MKKRNIYIKVWFKVKSQELNPGSNQEVRWCSTLSFWSRMLMLLMILSIVLAISHKKTCMNDPNNSPECLSGLPREKSCPCMIYCSDLTFEVYIKLLGSLLYLRSTFLKNPLPFFFILENKYDLIKFLPDFMSLKKFPGSIWDLALHMSSVLLK